MKILFLTHTFPWPLNDGVRLHLYYILKELAPSHEIHLLCLNDVPVSEEDKKAVAGLGLSIAGAFTHTVPQGFWSRVWNSFMDPVPFAVRQFESVELRTALKNFLAANPMDVVHADYLSMGQYRAVFQNVPAVFFPHDAVSMLFERNVGSETNLFRKAYTYLQWRKIKQFEADTLPQFQATMVVSPVDREHLLRHCPDTRIAVSPNGVDVDYFKPQDGTEEENAILFRGVMNFQPNTDAARYFYNDILPLVRKQIPGAVFYVVGKEPPADLIEASKRDAGLKLTGYVQDLREWTARSAVVVSPMRIGSGIKNKVLESMAMAKANVCTTMACAGIDAVNGEHLWTADEPQAFADRVVALLKDRSARDKMGRSALEFVRKYYTWKRNADDFEALYREVSGKKP